MDKFFETPKAHTGQRILPFCKACTYGHLLPRISIVLPKIPYGKQYEHTPDPEIVNRHFMEISPKYGIILRKERERN